MATTKRATYIYRIQKPNGTGPYQNEDMDLRGSPRHPGLGRDLELGYHNLRNARAWVCGFRSKAQLRFWFFEKATRERLAALGYSITKWKVPAGMASVSDAQAIFWRDKATLVETMPLA